VDEIIQELARLIDDMAWDYDRFSTSGKETYDKICSLMAQLTQ
jgi:hypothetical protein